MASPEYFDGANTFKYNIFNSLFKAWRQSACPFYRQLKIWSGQFLHHQLSLGNHISCYLVHHFTIKSWLTHYTTNVDLSHSKRVKGLVVDSRAPWFGSKFNWLLLSLMGLYASQFHNKAEQDLVWRWSQEFQIFN